MSYHGDIALGSTINLKFTTRNSSGAMTTLAGSPVISAYVGSGTTELTAGITLTVDFDSRTGLNNVTVVASGGNGYAAATDVELVITTGTVNSVSVVGEVIGSFSINNRVSNVTQWNGTAVSTPATAGIPDVNVKNINNVAAATPGAAGGVFIAGTNAATTVTTALTTTFTGNLTGSVASVTADVGITQAAADKVFGTSGAAMAELSGVPSATPSPRNALMLLFMTLRNKLTTTATAKTIFNDANTSIASKVLSDDGTTYTETKMS